MRSRPAATRPDLETLEDRSLPSAVGPHGPPPPAPPPPPASPPAAPLAANPAPAAGSAQPALAIAVAVAARPAPADPFRAPGVEAQGVWVIRLPFAPLAAALPRTVALLLPLDGL